MSYKALNNLQAVDLDSLERSSTVKEYPLGMKIHINNTDNGSESVFMYVASHAALTIGKPLMLVGSVEAEGEVQTAAPAEYTVGQGQLIGFPNVAVAENSYFWAQISGIVPAVAAGTVAQGDHVEVLAGGPTVVVDGTSGSTTQTANSIGIAKSATSGGFISLSIIPDTRVHIAAS